MILDAALACDLDEIDRWIGDYYPLSNETCAGGDLIPITGNFDSDQRMSFLVAFRIEEMRQVRAFDLARRLEIAA